MRNGKQSRRTQKFCCWNTRKHWVDLKCIREMGLLTKCTFDSGNGESKDYINLKQMHTNTNANAYINTHKHCYCY